MKRWIAGVIVAVSIGAAGSGYAPRVYGGFIVNMAR
jgi:hypothetical protein